MEAISQGGMNCDVELDKKRQAQECVNIQDKSAAV
jgi:hypothetical protein